MTLALASLSLIIVLLSMYGVLRPVALTSLVQRFMSHANALWVAVAVRLLLAILLWFSAPVSHTPLTFQVLAVLAAVAAGALLIVGSSKVTRLLDWVAVWRPLAIRLWCLLGVGFGVFLLWSLSLSLTMRAV
jgi:hypothetical protein